MECCRSEQLSSILDAVVPFLQDIQSQEAKRAIAIIELLTTQHYYMINIEKDKMAALFIAKTELCQLMKKSFLNESTPISIKESIAYIISIWQIINTSTDLCFKPILELLQNILKTEEDRLNQHPYELQNEPKRNKYGMTTLESILIAYGLFSIRSDDIKNEIAKRGGINIGLKYLNHPSKMSMIAASCIIFISCDRSNGLEFRKNNNYLAIINETIHTPKLEVVSQYDDSQSYMHLPNFHSGWLKDVNLCVNCDLHQSSNSTEDGLDLQYRFIRNLICNIRDFIKVDHQNAIVMCRQMKERIEKRKEINSIQTNNQNGPIDLTQSYSDILSKIILYLYHPYTKIRYFSIEVLEYMFQFGEKEWIIQETKEIQLRQKIRVKELKNRQNMNLEIVQVEYKEEPLPKCHLSAIPIILKLLLFEENDELQERTLWALQSFLDRLIELRIEEKDEKMQKILENEEADIQIECEQCREMVSFGRFLSHMKGHNAMVDIHYEVNSKEEEKEDANDIDNAKSAQKRVLEDIENEGLVESAQTHLYQAKLYKHNAAKSFYKRAIGIGILN
ncbi:MAG: hypothetical protein EZS28_037859 [Streblomastix strix]|uniref:Uncharacterized protein n=1 Tax=Streblomastix strix TaxID=222440 RepID=A0A5J4U8S8_9EUKA|nr:MAG: hypothetical protein EZS28_037859 [Streblomastix strix]